MKFIIATRKSIEANIEAAVSACCNIATGQPTDESHIYKIITQDFDALIHCSDTFEWQVEPVIVVPFPVPHQFTWLDPTASLEILRPFLRGVLRAAVAIWAKDRKYGIDFDGGGIFYRRPYSMGERLAYHNVVIVDAAHHCGATRRTGMQDLVLAAFGRLDEGLPKLEFFMPDYGEATRALLNDWQRLLLGMKPDQLAPFRLDDAVSPLVTTLPSAQTPAWFSYEQWMRKLAGTSQGAFIVAPLAGPQRVDGPAGSGKTLSLVLRCLHVLKQAKALKAPHHAAFVVFSDETKAKITDAFLTPLDEDGFHSNDRSTAPQSLTITTLLEWSRHELEPVVGKFSLPAGTPTQARMDQNALVAEALKTHLASFIRSGGGALSHGLRSVCSGELSPVLVRMFLHEFGVVIKGIADSNLRHYLKANRPMIALPCSNEADRRFIFALFERYQELLHEYGFVDLDDVAVSHIKLLQMPLRRENRERMAFDSVFVDEAHSFNPNELAIFFLLTRRSELPSLVVAVDLPQAGGDKGYEGEGLSEAMFQEFEATERVEVRRFQLGDVQRCTQQTLDLAASIYAEGHQFLAPIRMPASLRSENNQDSTKPVARGFPSRVSMLDGILASAEECVERFKCKRSEVLIVLMNDGLCEDLPKKLAMRSEVLRMRGDTETERRAQRFNHFIVSPPDFLHGLEYEVTILVGVSQGDLPRLDQGPLGAGTAAIFETQRAVDLLYLALTRARRTALVLYAGSPSFLLNNAISRGILAMEVFD